MTCGDREQERATDHIRQGGDRAHEGIGLQESILVSMGQRDRGSSYSVHHKADHAVQQQDSKTENLRNQQPWPDLSAPA
jgi:hypothetical protein